MTKQFFSSHRSQKSSHPLQKSSWFISVRFDGNGPPTASEPTPDPHPTNFPQHLHTALFTVASQYLVPSYYSWFCGFRIILGYLDSVSHITRKGEECIKLLEGGVI